MYGSIALHEYQQSRIRFVMRLRDFESVNSVRPNAMTASSPWQPQRLKQSRAHHSVHLFAIVALEQSETK
jgi:hypothetical protein